MTTAIVVGAAALYGAYLSYTSFGQRNYDGGAQIQYLRYLIEHRALPPAAHCHVCHHPPLYYLLAAPVLEVARLAGLPKPPQAGERCLNTRSQTPWPRRSPRSSNLVSGRWSGLGAKAPSPNSLARPGSADSTSIICRA